MNGETNYCDLAFIKYKEGIIDIFIKIDFKSVSGYGIWLRQRFYLFIVGKNS
jgi:hypothetical protein